MNSKAVLVVLNYNDSDTAIKLADKVKDYDCLNRVILVDNCSPDDSYGRLSDRYKSEDKIDVIKSPSNNGYASGNNYGIKYAEKEVNPDYIFIGNPDIDVEENTLKSMITCMENHKDYGVIAPIVEEGYNVWNLPGFIGMIESLFLVWFNLDKRAIKKRLLKSENEIENAGVVEGSFFLIRREDYDAIDGLDERTFLYSEEIILAKRLEAINKKVGVMPSERYHHYHSVSIRKAYKSSKRKAFPNFYKSFRIYNKYYLHTNALQDVIFKICYGLAYLERGLYDVIKNIRK